MLNSSSFRAADLPNAVMRERSLLNFLNGFLNARLARFGLVCSGLHRTVGPGRLLHGDFEGSPLHEDHVAV